MSYLFSLKMGAVDFSIRQLKGIYKFTLDFAINMCILTMSFSVITYGGLRMMSVSAGQTSAILKLSMPLLYSVLPVSGIATMVFTLKNIIDDMLSFSAEDEADRNSAAENCDKA